MKNFENIINILSEEKKQKPLSNKLLLTVFNITAISMLVAMFFDAIIRSSGDWVKITITFFLVTLILALIALAFIVLIKWLVLGVKNKTFRFRLPKLRNLFSLGDELINRLRLDEKGFFKKVNLLEDYDKNDLEKFRDWLDYRIKLEGVIVAVMLAFIKYLPSLKEHFYSLFREGGIFFSFGLTNPFTVAIFPVSMDMILLFGTLVIVGLTSFLPRRLRFFYMVKYAVAHECHK